MVFGSIRDLQDFPWLEESVLRALRYAEEHDLASYEKGRHDIDGDDLYVNIAEYETSGAEKHVWEAHRQYLDLHLMLRGTERIDLNFISNMEQKEYVPDEDFLPLFGVLKSSVIMTEGDFLLACPKDAHRPGVAVSEPMAIKKAIFKIKIK